MTVLGIAASLLFGSVDASAQGYLGGSLSFRSSSSSTSNGSSASATTFTIAPNLGWFVGDKWAVGIRPTVGFGSSNAFTVGINPYARYQFLALDSFGIWAEADPMFNYSKASGGHSTTYGVELMPVLTYELNDHILLESRLNLFSLSVMGSHTASDDGQDRSIFSAGLSATTKNIAGSLGDITIGFLYRF